MSAIGAPSGRRAYRDKTMDNFGVAADLNIGRGDTDFAAHEREHLPGGRL